MQSAHAISYEIDDPVKAARELSQQIKQSITLLKNRCGILFCDPDTDPKPLIDELYTEFGAFSLLGCSAMATLTNTAGYSDLSQTFTMLTADDCEFALGSTAPLTESNYRQEIEKAYNETLCKLEDKDIKLVIPFCPTTPTLSPTQCLDELDRLTDHVPIFGGLSSESFELEHRLYCGDQVLIGAMVFLLISGNIKPRFAMVHSLSTQVEHKCRITHAEEDIVYTIDGQPFTNYFKDLGFKVDYPNVFLSYIGTPFVIEFDENSEYGKGKVIRSLKSFNLEDGSARFLARVYQGANCSMGLIRKDEIAESTRLTIQRLWDQTGDSPYNTILCNSCSARYMIMGDTPEIEGDIVKELIPPDITLIGFYAFGEICPTAVQHNKAHNDLHNCSFTLCGF